jgi:hypothetical protein
MHKLLVVYGSVLLDSRRYTDARRAFRESHSLSRHPTTLALYLISCTNGMGRALLNSIKHLRQKGDGSA